MRRRVIQALIGLLAILTIGFLIPERPFIPVKGATRTDWHPKSFWFEPWGQSGAHKGVDIFAKQGKSVLSAIPGVLIYRGQSGIGGNVVAIFGRGGRGSRYKVYSSAHLS